MHKPINAAIKLVEGVDFSHYAYLINGMVYEAVSPKSKQTHFTQWRQKYNIIRTYTVDVPAEKELQFMQIIEKQLDVPYAYSQIIAILLANIFHISTTSDFNGKRALICSEFVARPLVEVSGYTFSVPPDMIGMDELEAGLKLSTR